VTVYAHYADEDLDIADGVVTHAVREDLGRDVRSISVGIDGSVQLSMSDDNGRTWGDWISLSETAAGANQQNTLILSQDFPERKPGLDQGLPTHIRFQAVTDNSKYQLVVY
jgi:hypothetical protein